MSLDMNSLTLIAAGLIFGALAVFVYFTFFNKPAKPQRGPLPCNDFRRVREAEKREPVREVVREPEFVPGPRAPELLKQLRERKAQRDQDAEIALLLRDQVAVPVPPKTP